MYDVITMGSSTVDVFARTESELIKIKTIHGEEELIAYPSGSKILIHELLFFVGGGGTNTAVSFSRLGLKTAFLGMIGKDENGIRIKECLKEENVDFIGGYGEKSGYSVILDSIEEDRTILTYKGCNNELKNKNIDYSNLKTKWFYFSSMMEESFKTMEKVADFAVANKIKIAFNPSIYQISLGSSALKNILEKITILIFNKDESEALVGIDSVENNLKKIMKLGPKIVAITDGKNGVHCFDGDYYYQATPRKIKIAETTGAGDAFASGFVAGLIMNKNIEFCIKLGMNNAESEIQVLGVKKGLLKLDEALKLIKKDDRKFTKKKM